MTTDTDSDTLVTVAGAPAIPGLRFRRPRGDDAEYEALAELMSATSAADEIPWRPTAEHIRDEIERPDRLDPAQDVILGEIDGRLIAMGQVERILRDGVVVFYLNGHVHPEWRRRGIGAAVFDADIRRGEERARDEAPDALTDLGAFVEATELGHRALLDGAGFEPIRWFNLMRRDLGDPIPDAPLPDGLEIRPLTPDAPRRLRRRGRGVPGPLGRNARRPTATSRMTYAQKEIDTDLWVVAWDGDEVAGVVQNWIWPEENARLGVARGWLEHISVRRPWRRRGLARAITANSLRRFRDAGMTDAMLGVDTENPNGALGLYEGLGFVVALALDTPTGGRCDRRPAQRRPVRLRRWRCIDRGVRLEDPIMRAYLIVANQTLTSESLADAITARMADGPIRTHVVVPLSPVGGRLTWDEEKSRDAAKERLDEVLGRLREMGADADGEVGDRDPVWPSTTPCAASRSTRSSSRRCRGACRAGSARMSRAVCATRSRCR